MTKRPTSRLSIAVTLGFVVVLAQLGAFAAMSFSAWHDVTSPSSRYFRFPVTTYPQVLRGELVFPVCSLVYKTKMITTGEMQCLRAINLQTGAVREIETPNAKFPQGTVTNGERLWCFGGNEIYEFDGTTVVRLETKGLPGAGDRVSLPFLYEGNLAMIDRDLAGNNRLRVLLDGEWQDKGQVATPGKDRTWAVDEQSGESVLVPRTSANSIAKGSTWLLIQVFGANGKYHLMQTDLQGVVGTKRTPTFCYRVGFDFVTKPADGEPISALAPDNSTADTTGWTLVDSRFRDDFGSHAALNDDLFFANGQEVWRQVRSEGLAPSTKFESIAKVEAAKYGCLSLASTADSRQVYVVVTSFKDEGEVYRLEDRQLHKLPFRLEGITAPMQRWIAKMFFQGLAVVSTGTVLLIFLAGYWTGTINYAFGHESVVLASLILRSLARAVDLSLIFGPLTIHGLWLFRYTFGASIAEVLSMESINALAPLIPATAWLGLTWTVFIASTGLWGVTPGKWLFGIRVVRMTLRPCGVLTALLRELMFWIDMPQLLTAIPGVLCLIATEHRQRIGDLVAGTLVVEAA